MLRSVRALGTASPLRARLEDSAEILSGEEPVVDLGLVTNLSSFDVAAVSTEYDIPVEMQPLVAQYIQFFQGPGRKWFRKWMSRSTRYIPMMQPVLEQQRAAPGHRLPGDDRERLLRPAPTPGRAPRDPGSSSPRPARRFGLRQDFWVDERRDPIKATCAAGRLPERAAPAPGPLVPRLGGLQRRRRALRRMVERQRHQRLLGAVRRARASRKETKHYVPKLIACALVAKHPHAFGFSDDEFEFQKPLEFDEVRWQTPTDLDVLARAAGIGTEEPAGPQPGAPALVHPACLRRPPYLVRVPRGSRETVIAALARIPAQERLTYRIHHVRKGDTLSRIAVQYHSAPEAILQFNRLKSAKTLKINTELAIPVPSSAALADSGHGLERQVARARAQGYLAPPPRTRSRPARAPAIRGRSPRARSKPRSSTARRGCSTACRRAESPWTIAQRYGVSVEQLQFVELARTDRRGRSLEVGALLTIRPDRAPAPIEAGPAAAVVARQWTVPPPSTGWWRAPRRHCGSGTSPACTSWPRVRRCERGPAVRPDERRATG